MFASLQHRRKFDEATSATDDVTPGTSEQAIPNTREGLSPRSELAEPSSRCSISAGGDLAECPWQWSRGVTCICRGSSQTLVTQVPRCQAKGDRLRFHRPLFSAAISGTPLTATTSLQTLRVIKYVCSKGSSDFKRAIAKHATAIR